MASKTNTCKVTDLEFDGIGGRYEDFIKVKPQSLEKTTNPQTYRHEHSIVGARNAANLEGYTPNFRTQYKYFSVQPTAQV